MTKRMVNIVPTPAPPAQALEGYQAELFESFRQLGLSETDARHAAVDAQTAHEALGVQTGLTFGRLSMAEAQQQLRSIAERGARRPAPLSEVKRRELFGLPPLADGGVQMASQLDLAESEVQAARTFGRAPKQWAVEALRNKPKEA